MYEPVAMLAVVACVFWARCGLIIEDLRNRHHAKCMDISRLLRAARECDGKLAKAEAEPFSVKVECPACGLTDGPIERTSEPGWGLMQFKCGRCKHIWRTLPKSSGKEKGDDEG